MTIPKKPKKTDEPTIDYKGETEKEKQENVRSYTLISNFLKRSAVELTHNEQYALIDGLSNFADIKKQEGEKFNLPNFKGDNERERIENSVFATLVQNVLQRFETRITEDERDSLYKILMIKVVEK
jgi:hypothetical protein